ncbi:MAG: chromate efflux transporter [Chloroflexi bacterium]|nr:chromate efflux transporter [Chloroflexota bacterium]MCI0648393.1 chromate efflux transporter [Chloroflexota bacterium]MCI0727514.1 chromate efflux transporter [Chloroflexota bacterium]
MTARNRRDLWEVVRLFLRLGFTAFGGPAAHIAMMHDEVVERRHWFSEQRFLDMVGATNLIPGPNSTEMAIHIGYDRAGWRGLIAAGLCFILPAVLIVGVLAWVYTRYGATPQGEALLYGVKPVIVVIVVQALWKLGRKAVKGWILAVLGMVVLVLYLLGVNELLLLFGSTLAYWSMRTLSRQRQAVLLLPPLAAAGELVRLVQPAPVRLDQLFLLFLKVGSVLYGGGYVLLAFLRNDLVVRLGWLTDQQLLDAIAVGQFTPGPLFTTATFVGYILAGVPGAALATLGIFLPSFVFVAALKPLVSRLRNSTWTAPLLDGVNVTALGLMAGVTWQLGRAALVDLSTWLLAAAAAVLLFRFRVNSVWLVLGGGLVGLALLALR